MTTQETLDINKTELLSRVQKMKNEGFCLTQICATKLEQFILLYSFEKEDQLINLRIILDFSEQIESISGLYSYAFIYENEMKDLFDVKVNNINLDFKGNFYQTSVKTPFNIIEKEVKEDG